MSTNIPPFPFSAIVGQEPLKRALLLGVIQPRLGGVLIRGTKGVAKSTAVRALAALLPPIETVAGCPVQRRPGEDLAAFPLPSGACTVQRPLPLVELPLGATEDRVLGSLHLERALRGQRAFEPGLLAAANRGILYIDEVNLLPDHLVDILLDAAASGIHRVEREGISLEHPAEFLLVGTMNPEEGELRPQLLDRFGLAVAVADLTDVADRAEAVRRRLAYENDPNAFVNLWAAADRAEAERVLHAQQLLAEVKIPEAILQALSTCCLAVGVEGLRADLTLCRAACAWAAYQGRTEVEPADVDMVAELALAHRRTRPPQPPGGNGQGDGEKRQGDKETRRQGDKERGPGPLGSLVFESAGLFAAKSKPPTHILKRSTQFGGWRQGKPGRRGDCAGPIRVYRNGYTPAWAATLRAAGLRGEENCKLQIANCKLQIDDLRGWPRRGAAGCLLLFLVDASGSMAAWQRMRQTKAAILSLLVQAYRRRDQVALLAFRGRGTELVLPPTRGLLPARQALERLPVGGATPLAHGLATAGRLVRLQQRRQTQQPIWMVVLTDGRSNVALTGDPWQDALAQARALAGCGAACLVVNTETGWPRLGLAVELAHALGASCQGLDEVLGRPLPDPWRQAV
jgi:magnesium chelatase subunit D